MNLKNFTLRLILAFILFIIIFEMVLRAHRGLPSLESDPPQFKYQYEEIYKRFFRKIRLSNGRVVYKSQRNRTIEQSFPASKIEGTKRIFVLGGSVAWNFATHAGGRHLRELLESSIPGERFEVITCGGAGYDSYRISLIHKEILNYDPDFIILLSGNNEYYNPVRVNLWAYRLNRLFRDVWIYRDLQDRLLTWGRVHGMYNNISQENRLKNYENNLKIMIRRAKKRNIPMVLCALPANFRDSPPKGVPAWEDKQFFIAWNSLNKKEFEEARNEFEQFIVRYPQDAFGHYFLAKCYDALENYSLAQKYYLKALDLDAKPGDRCPPQRNEIIRRLCTQENAILVDLEKAFIRIVPHGLVGKELFIDSHHWWREYYSLVCEEIVQSIIGYYKTHLESPFASLDKWRYNLDSKRQDFLESAPIDPEERALRVALSAIAQIYWDVDLINGKILFLNERTVSFFTIAYQMNSKLFDNSSFLKKQLFKGTSTNIFLQEMLPQFEDNWPIFLYHIGESFRRLGIHLKAIEYFNEAINLSPDLYFPYLGRALVYYEIGQIDRAKRDFEEIAKKSYQHPLMEFYRELLGI